MHAKVDTEGTVSPTMAEKPWYKPVFFTLVALGLLLIVIGARFTEPGADEIAYGTSGQFVIDASNVDASIIVITDEVEGNCENFAFSVDLLRDGNYDFIPVEKTDCKDWSSSNSYQYRLTNLTEGRYGFSASDWVSIMAVEGDLDAFMDDYAFGNAVADIGTGMCCLSIILNVFIGRSLAKANKEEQVVLSGGQTVTVDAQTNFVQAVSTIDADTPEEAAIEQETAPEEAVVKQEEASGSFWGGIKDD